MPVRELAPAKINLTLSVLGRRTDGYHELESLVTFADVHDVVTLEPGAAGSVVVAGPFAGYIGGENLLVRALTLLADADHALRLGSVRLDKHLPVAAGIGGGSADAAALLRAVKRANPERAANIAWLDIAARLGADVPVCLGARPALMWGIGEKTEPLRRLLPAHAVLVNPGLPLSTADVFRALDAGPAPVAHAAPEAYDLAGLTDLIDTMRARGNDLERPATRLLPVIGEIKAALEAEAGCHLAAMAGSGPTCFGIFADRPHADRAASRIAGAHGDWWVKATVLQGSPAA
jgi:4-diphosphocytidyl-2-C-methyl-D-erythritol kinase